MAYTFVRDNVIYVRWKNAPDRKPKWPTATLNAETGRPFANETEGKRWGAEQEVKARLGLLDEPEPAPEEAPEMTVADWFAKWWRGLDVGLKSRGNYAYYFRVYILPEWGHWPLSAIKASDVNAWELRLIDAGYERDGVPAGARTRLTTLLGDAVTEGLIGSNPAPRQRHRGRRSGVRTGGRGQERRITAPLQWLMLSERLGVMSGRDEEFVLGLLLTFGALRYGEAVGLQRRYVKLGKVRVDWQLEEIGGRWYLLPPKDDSHRDVDIPPFLQTALARLVAQQPERRCRCEPFAIDGQKEQPCQGGGPFVFLGERGGHLRNNNFARRVWIPAVDGRYPSSKGERRPDGKPVLVELDSVWPGVPIAPWPRAVPGQVFERPAASGFRGRSLGLGVNVASSRADLVTFAIGQGVSEREAHQMTREQIIDRFIRPRRISEDVPVASWLPIEDGFTPHEVRRSHSTLLHGLGTELKLRDERMGHVSPEMRGMRNIYTGIMPEWRVRLRGELQEVGERALAERAWFGLHSPVPMLNDLLAPFRDGRRSPVSPLPSTARVIDLAARGG